jgi:DNA recombination protein RmuC
LIDDSMRQNVMLATPTSLIALLKVVSYGWKQTMLADNAAEIRGLGEDLYKRLAVFGEHLGKLGKSSAAASSPSTRPWARSNSRFCPRRAAFEGLGLRVNRVIEPLEPVATLPRIRAADASQDASGEAGSEST